MATRYWQVLSQVNLVLEEFAARLLGQDQPGPPLLAHLRHRLYAVLRPASSTSRAADDPVTREAYSREVISSGFWFGDDAFPEPAFYSYTAPEPAGLGGEPLRPEAARWITAARRPLAVLRYDDARAEADPRAAVLGFYESAYQAGARRAGWDVAGLACPGGITDPSLIAGA